MQSSSGTTLLVCDLDNTLYDWVGYFVPSLYHMIDRAVELTGCDREQLLDDLREVHRWHHDSEHPFSLLETRTIKRLYPHHSSRGRAILLDDAFHAFNSQRKESLRVFPGVHETLETLAASGVTLVAHTESKLYAVVDRLSRLDLAKYFTRIYCRERTETEHPYCYTPENWLRNFPMDRVTELSHHQRKPNPSVLRDICDREGATPDRAGYVGDSVARDIMMAQGACVFSIWAAYGAAHTEEDYERLVRISHWTDEDVEREMWLKHKAEDVQPDYTLRNSFSEILAALRIDA